MKKNEVNVLINVNETIENERALSVYTSFMEKVETEKEETIANYIANNSTITIEKEYDNIFDLIVSEKLHEKITIGIIKCLAKNPIKRKNSNIVDFSQTIPYIEMINKGFTESIVDDLKQEVYIAMHEMILKNQLVKEENKLIFKTYYDKNDNEKSCYLLLFKTIRNYVNKEKRHDKNGKFSLDDYTILENENKDSEKKNIVTVNHNSNTYIQYLACLQKSNSMETLSQRVDIKSIMRMIKKDYPKHYSNIVTVFAYRYKGLTYDEIALKMNLTKNKVRYCIEMLRNTFNKYAFSIDSDSKDSNSIFYGCTTYVNKQIFPTKKDIDNYFVRVEKEKSKPKYASHSYPLTCGIISSYDDNKLYESMKLEKNTSTIGNYSYTFMYNQSNNTLVTVDNDTNKIIHEYTFHDDYTQKNCKKELPIYKA